MTVQSGLSNALLANRYRLLRPLGRGGMGALYLARDLRFGNRYVALKENGERSAAAQVQFRLEAEVLATLHHPHLPAVTDYFTTPDGRQFLVMDYVEGENLEELVARAGDLGEAQVLVWAGQLLDALAYLHAQSPPVIHRDVKPQNVIIRPGGGAPPLAGGAGGGGGAVLVDFGVAKYMVPGQPTATVARAGSPGYAPIEQYAGGTDQRSDIYSLGATLYFVLTGQTPPESPLLMSGQTLPHPRQLNPAISQRTEAMVLRAMQPEASSRFQSVQEMQAALQGNATPVPAGRRVLDDVRRLSRKQKSILLLGTILVLLTLCALGWAMGGSMWPQDPTPTIAPPTAATVEVVSTATPVLGDVSTPVTPTEATATPGKPTSTPKPTNTPTPTRRPPTPTYTPTATATPQPPPPPQPTSVPEPTSEPTTEPTSAPTNPPPP